MTYVTRKDLIGSWELGFARLRREEEVVVDWEEMTGKMNLKNPEEMDSGDKGLVLIFGLVLFRT